MLSTNNFPSLFHECISEFIGTWLLVFIGTGTVACAVTTGSLIGLWQVGVLWGFGVTLSIYVAAHGSSAHLNPAVTISLAVSRHTNFPRCKVLPYIIAQVVGAMFSSVCVLMIYGPAIRRYEEINYITRGEDNSTLTAMMFGEYFPNPAVVSSGAVLESDIGFAQACFIEGFGTMILMLMIRVLTDDNNMARPSPQQTPFYIGFTVAVVLCLTAPLTQAGLNPARDFGPRVIAALAGWGSIAIPGPNTGFLVYIIGPIIGAIVAGFIYDFLVLPTYLAKNKKLENSRIPLDTEITSPSAIAYQAMADKHGNVQTSNAV